MLTHNECFDRDYLILAHFDPKSDSFFDLLFMSHCVDETPDYVGNQASFKDCS